MSVWGKITGKRKKFLSLLCDRMDPYEACRKVWPGIKDVHGHVTSICADPDFKEVYAKLTAYQSSQEQLIMDCRRIIESDDSANDNKLTAIRAIATMKGYIRPGPDLGQSSKRHRLSPVDDDKLLEKIAELAMKTKGKDNGHSQKPS